MVDINNHIEVSAMSESCQILSDTLNLVEKNIIPGQSVLELDKIAENYILSCDAKPAFKGYNGFPATLTVSIDDEIVHGIPKDVLLKEGQIVSIDCGVIKNEFYSDSARTIAVGKISDDKAKLLDVTKKALQIGIEKAVIGNKVFDISDSIQKYVESEGYSVVRELVGHGLGKSLHEEPDIPNFGTENTGPKIQNGLVVAIEPMINLGGKEVEQGNDGWTVITKDRKPSAHFEHNIAVIDGKPNILSSFDFIEKD